MNLKNIIWKDIFKPRWAVLFQVDHHPVPAPNGVGLTRRYFACVKLRPFKRDLDVSFNNFYNDLSKTGNVVAAYGWVLRLLYGIGSTNCHNMRNPIIVESLATKLKKMDPAP